MNLLWYWDFWNFLKHKLWWKNGDNWSQNVVKIKSASRRKFVEIALFSIIEKNHVVSKFLSLLSLQYTLFLPESNWFLDSTVQTSYDTLMIIFKVEEN